MGQYNVQDAKTRLSELLHLVERGDEVVIARSGRPVAKLVPIELPAKRPLGFLGPSERLGAVGHGHGPRVSPSTPRPERCRRSGPARQRRHPL
nr:type II toxin-antitoxin system prevent-host-death family antitoxin [Arthrobacter roseus]